MFDDLANRAMVASIPRVIRAAGKQRLSILIYHRVHSTYDYMRDVNPTVEQFNWQMELLSEHFNPLPLSEALSLLELGKLPERTVCVTFDDGYADNATLALPLLAKWKIPATVFVSTEYLDGGRMWNDSIIEVVKNTRKNEIDLTPLGLGKYILESEASRKQSAYDIVREVKYLPPEKRNEVVQFVEELSGPAPCDLMLTSEQLKFLHANGVEIGGHTHSHPILASLDNGRARSDIGRGKEELEKILKVPVRYFAYPNGLPGKDYLPVHTQMVRELGFEAAVTTHWGVSSIATDRWQLNRFTPWDKAPRKFLARLLLNLQRLN